jgi:hypothetical protein
VTKKLSSVSLCVFRARFLRQRFAVGGQIVTVSLAHGASAALALNAGGCPVTFNHTALTAGRRHLSGGGGVQQKKPLADSRRWRKH